MWWRGAKQSRPAAPPIVVLTCTLFYSYFRLHARIEANDGIEPSARVLIDGTAPMQQVKCRGLEIFIDALVDPDRFPGNGTVEITLGGRVAAFTLDFLLAAAQTENNNSLSGPFKAEIAVWIAAHSPARPALLAIGGDEKFPECEVTGFDLDAHALSRHFPPATFDFAQSISVFEHLAMPWQAAVEINRVLKPGGVAHIATHQTAAIRDKRCDFFRFSDASFTGLFNRYTGFEIMRTLMSNNVHIMPRAWSEHYRDDENAIGFDRSAVIVRKIGEAMVSWDGAAPVTPQ